MYEKNVDVKSRIIYGNVREIEMTLIDFNVVTLETSYAMSATATMPAEKLHNIEIEETELDRVKSNAEQLERENHEMLQMMHETIARAKDIAKEIDDLNLCRAKTELESETEMRKEDSSDKATGESTVIEDERKETIQMTNKRKSTGSLRLSTGKVYRTVEQKKNVAVGNS